MSKIIGIVSSYFPNLDELEKNINSYLPSIDYLIIWENTPKEKSNIDLLVSKLNSNKVEVRSSGKNEYLAYPINQCVKWAENQGFTHVLTMDQDSFFLEKHFEIYRDFIENNRNDEIAIFSPTLNKVKTNFDTYIEVDNAITSGTIYALKIFEKIGYFREDFLIYMIDIEFGIRARLNGYKIFQLSNVNLIHQSGYEKKSKLGYIINFYPAQSTYYIIRNTVLTWKIYPNQFPLSNKLIFIKYKVVYRICKICFEPNIILKLKAIFLGLIHGCAGKFGRFDI